MKLLHLSLLAAVFIGSCVLVLQGDKFIAAPQIVTPVIARTSTYPLLPTLVDSSVFPVVSAQSVFAQDKDSSVVLYEKNADKKVLPASTTKIMTALVALDAYQLQDTIEVPNFWIEGQKLNLKAGSTYTVSDLLYAMLLYSANDAAEVLARHYPGGRGAFIAQMNTKAQTLSLMNSHFMNPVGLDQAGHYSTARDMVRLSMIAMDNPVFSTIVSTKEKTITSVDGTQVHVLRNINQLLGTVDGVMGVKTGWTEEARENLVTYVTRGNKHVHIALLGSQDRFGETTELITWLFSSYSWKPVSLPLLSTR